jgi:protein-L-isoaspartate(D-aspartate) O-methyltransferase
VANTNADWISRREAMVRDQIQARGIADRRVLAAMRCVPRHLFVPDSVLAYAYADEPLPIGDGQTISQPYIVAYMTKALGLDPGARVLEIGTGSGYQTAVLAEIAASVFTIEIIAGLAARAKRLLDALGYTNIRFRTGDGTFGWPEEAPFDAIIAAAAPVEVPAAWPGQLTAGGALVLPVGAGPQALFRVVREGAGWRQERLLDVRFVPLIRDREGASS